MLKWLIIVAAGYLLFKMFSNDRRQAVTKDDQEKETMADAGEMVKDPVCGSFVSLDSDIRVREGAKVHRFCSYECRDKYIKQVQAAQAQNQVPNKNNEG